MLAFLLLLIIPVALITLARLAELLPYVGSFVQIIGPLLALLVNFGIGKYAGERALRLPPASPPGRARRAKRAMILTYALAVCTATFWSAYVVGY